MFATSSVAVPKRGSQGGFDPPFLNKLTNMDQNCQNIGIWHSTFTKEAHFHPLEVVSRYRDPQLQVGEYIP